MSLLSKSNPTGTRIVGSSVAEPMSLGFAAYRLEAGEILPLAAQAREQCVVVLGGRVSVNGEAQGQGAFGWANIGARHSVFERRPPYAIYLPPNSQAQFLALGPASLAVCSAPGAEGGPFPARLITPDSMRRSMRGKGTGTCLVYEVLSDAQLIHSLLVIEVHAPPGYSSGCLPPVQAPEGDALADTVEELCYHQVSPVDRFVFQRVYTFDRHIDQAMAVENHDLVSLPKGLHPLSVPLGCESYCLSVKAASPLPGRRDADWHDL
ncbi:5-deoxy-glucuronate isomerase [uncultured Pseudomonas sp.]|uniref:5-deoxy-glucuronate isomerase n=1 Tax=uncultured Pseudomonas sp. TaxID=114707 RepID=UPI0025F573EA|nr:5-deoxy-glucuronate isomerase [uncultured Pseudomonas sp.]